MRFKYSLRKMADLFANSGGPDQKPRSVTNLKIDVSCKHASGFNNFEQACGIYIVESS